MGLPRFSVVVPCYNYGRYLRQCVESIVLQHEVEVEVIIVNDCSTDDSSTVIDDIATRFDLVVVTHDHNLGLVPTLNDGLALSTGDFVMALSADDLLAPGGLRRLAQPFLLDPSVGLAYGPRVYFSDASQLPDPASYEQRSADIDDADVVVHRGIDWLERRCKHGVNPLTSPEVALRRAVQQRIGWYDPACLHTSDLNMWLRAAAAADVGFVKGPPVAYYRRHESNMSQVQFGSHAADLRQRWIAYDHALPIDSPDPQTAKLRAIARRTVTDQVLTRGRRAYEDGRLDDAAELTEVARSIDPVRVTRATRTRPDGSVHIRPRYLHRFVRRIKLRRWRRQWDRVGI